MRYTFEIKGEPGSTVSSLSSSEQAASCFECGELKQPSINLSRNGNTVKVFLADGDMDGHFLLDVLSKKRIVPLKFAVMEPTLESLFMEAIR